MSYVVVVWYRTEEGAGEQVAAALRQMVEPTRAEPGNQGYLVCRLGGGPDEFLLVEEYADELAFDAHRDTPHFQEHIVGTVFPLLAERERLDVVPLEA